MVSDIFDNRKELERLVVQNKLFKEYEQPVYRRLMEGRSGLRVLDVGSNNGSKTADRFAHPNVAKIIGLEYNQNLVNQARKTYEDRWFSFYQCDVEQPDFPRKLRGWMEENQVEAFDLIHISLVLMHLAEPGRVLGVLREFLAPEGRVMIIEANDTVNRLSPDPAGLFRDFMDILMADPFSGNRDFANTIPGLLEEQGYGRVVQENETMSAAGNETGKREAMFDTFFSYLPEDVALLRGQEPDNPLYAQWEAWLREHYRELQQRVLAKESAITLGLSIYTAAKGEGALAVQPLTEAYLDQVTALCGQCVGENLYPRSSLAAIIKSPDHYFSLLLAPEGEIAGYIYFTLSGLEDMARLSKLPRDRLAVVSEKNEPLIGNLQSIGIAEPWRGCGLSRLLVRHYLEQLQRIGADTAFGVFWKPQGQVPMERTLLGLQFRCLGDAPLVWYDREDLVCPYCRGRCVCDGAVYYKPIREEQL